MTSTTKPAVIVGAGPYGLSIAAHLRAQGVPVRVFGEVMSSWRYRMPVGMCLKSTPWASSLAAPGPGFTLADFLSAVGAPQLRENQVVPGEQFIRYGEWFAERLVPDVESAVVCRIDQRDSGFAVGLDTGEEVEAGSVIIANGLAGFAHVPDALAAAVPGGPAPDRAVSHSSQHHQLATFSGRQVAVIGAGQSALESAALLHESGADVQLISRAPVRFGDPPAEPEHSRLLPQPRTALGPSWQLYPFCYAAGAFRYLPERARLSLARKVLGPLGAWWLQDRVIGKFPVHAMERVAAARQDGDRVALRLASAGGMHRDIRVDHVLAATGYRASTDQLGFLSPDLRARLRTAHGSPRLSASFESAVPGIYIVSLAATATFGPLMRFVCGTGFTSRRVSAALAGRHQVA